MTGTLASVFAGLLLLWVVGAWLQMAFAVPGSGPGPIRAVPMVVGGLNGGRVEYLTVQLRLPGWCEPAGTSLGPFYLGRSPSGQIVNGRLAEQACNLIAGVQRS